MRFKKVIEAIDRKTIDGLQPDRLDDLSELFGDTLVIGSAYFRK